MALEPTLVVQSLDSRDSQNVFEAAAAVQSAEGSGGARIPLFSTADPGDLALFLLLCRLRTHLATALGAEERAVVIVDEGWKTAGSAYQMEMWDDVFHRGLIASASSSAVGGLQLADFVAYMLNRHQRLLSYANLRDGDVRLLRMFESLSDLWLNLEVTAGTLAHNAPDQHKLIINTE